MKKTQPTEYMYASARVRAMEKRIIGRERMDALLECRTSEEVMTRLAEYGMAPSEREGLAASDAREEMLLAALRAAYADVEASVPDPAPFRAFRYPYDCNNLKVAIKCAIRGIEDPLSAGLLFDFGTVPAERVEAILREGKELSLYPPAMSAAIPAARAAYDETSDPRMIDAILDRACYADMLAALAPLGDEDVTGWLRAKVDLVNILVCLRVLRMKRGAAGAAFLSDALLPGGTLVPGFFTDAYAGGESRLWAAVASTQYAALSRLEGDEPPLWLVEKTADDVWMGLVREGARAPFGAAVPAGYLLGWEVAVKNLRILLAAKDAGLATQDLRERIRVSYV